MDDDRVTADLSKTIVATTFANYPLNNLLEQDEALPFTQCDLTNSIHRLFAQYAFPDVEDYAVLVPGLRLASMLLQTENSMKYWYTMRYAPRVGRRFPPGSKWEQLYYNTVEWTQRPLSAREVAVINLDFLNLANVVRFYRSMEQGDCGATHFGEGRMTVNAECPGWTGQASCITYDERMYQEIVRLYRRAERRQRRQQTPQQRQDTLVVAITSPKLLRTYCGFAVTLLHELAHVWHIANTSSCTLQRPIGDLMVAESGYDWEQVVFGGVMENTTYDQVAQTIMEWPTSTIVNQYMRGGHSMFVVAGLP